MKGALHGCVASSPCYKPTGLAFAGAKKGNSRFMLEHTFGDLDENKLYNADFQPFPSGADLEMTNIVEQDYSEPDLIAGKQRLFYVRFDLELPTDVVSGYGPGVNERFFSVTRTLDQLGWKIDAIGTGF